MNSFKQIPRLSEREGRLIRVSDFFADGDPPPIPSYYVPAQTPYQFTNYLFSAPTVLIDINQWTPDGTDGGSSSGPHGLLPVRDNAWSYITPNAWIPVGYALRLPQYTVLSWNAKTFNEVPGDEPSLEVIMSEVSTEFHKVEDWLAEHRPGKSWGVVAVDTGITTVGPQPPVTNDPGLDIKPVEDESTSLVRFGSQAVIIDDPAPVYLGTNYMTVSVGMIEGNLIDHPLGSTGSLFASLYFSRIASYKALQYENPQRPEESFTEWEAAYADVGVLLNAEWGGAATGIDRDSLLVRLGEFFRFDPDTGEDLPL